MIEELGYLIKNRSTWEFPVIKKFRDLSFTIVLIFLIAIGVYWIMEQLQKDYLDQYINILGEKLISMVPESSEKKALSEMFDQFKTKVEKNEVSPEQVEKIAADIFNFSYLSDSLSYAEASALIAVPEVPEVPALEPDDKQWRELERRLESVYRFEQKSQVLPEIKFQVDQNLNILIDDKVRQTLVEKENEHLILEMKILENNKSVIWVKSLDSNIVMMREQLIQIRGDENLLEQEKLSEIKEVLVVAIDSLHSVISIKMDSIKYKYEYNIEKMEKEKKKGKSKK
jgi:hypothetical protein